MRALAEARKQHAEEEAHRAEQAAWPRRRLPLRPPEAERIPLRPLSRARHRAWHLNPSPPRRQSRQRPPAGSCCGGDLAARPSTTITAPVRARTMRVRVPTMGASPQRPRPPTSYDTRFAPREGGRPKNIDIPRAGSSAPARTVDCAVPLPPRPAS